MSIFSADESRHSDWDGKCICAIAACSICGVDVLLEDNRVGRMIFRVSPRANCPIFSWYPENPGFDVYIKLWCKHSSRNHSNASV